MILISPAPRPRPRPRCGGVVLHRFITLLALASLSTAIFGFDGPHPLAVDAAVPESITKDETFVEASVVEADIVEEGGRHTTIGVPAAKADGELREGILQSNIGRMEGLTESDDKSAITNFLTRFSAWNKNANPSETNEVTTVESSVESIGSDVKKLKDLSPLLIGGAQPGADGVDHSAKTEAILEFKSTVKSFFNKISFIDQSLKRGDPEAFLSAVKSLGDADRSSVSKELDALKDIVPSSTGSFPKQVDLQDASSLNLEEMSKSELFQVVRPDTFEDIVDLTEQLVANIEQFVMFSSPPDSQTTHASDRNDSFEFVPPTSDPHESYSDPLHDTLLFNAEKSSSRDPTNHFDLKTLFGHSNLKNVILHHEDRAHSSLKRHLKKHGSFNAEEVKMRHESRRSALGNQCPSSCAATDETCNCKKLFECARSMSAYDLALLLSRGYVETSPTDEKYGKFTVDELHLFDAEVGIKRKLLAIQDLLAGDTDVANCDKVLKHFHSACDPSEHKCRKSNKHSFQLTVKDVCDAVGSHDKLSFEEMGLAFDSFVGNKQIPCQPSSYDMCVEFAIEFDLLYQGRPPSYSSSNPMLVNAANSVHNKNGYDVLRHIQFPTEYHFNQDQYGVFNYTSFSNVNSAQPVSLIPSKGVSRRSYAMHVESCTGSYPAVEMKLEDGSINQQFYIKENGQVIESAHCKGKFLHIHGGGNMCSGVVAQEDVITLYSGSSASNARWFFGSDDKNLTRWKITSQDSDCKGWGLITDKAGENALNLRLADLGHYWDEHNEYWRNTWEVHHPKPAVSIFHGGKYLGVDSCNRGNVIKTLAPHHFRLLDDNTILSVECPGEKLHISGGVCVDRVPVTLWKDTGAKHFEFTIESDGIIQSRIDSCNKVITVADPEDSAECQGGSPCPHHSDDQTACLSSMDSRDTLYVDEIKIGGQRCAWCPSGPCTNDNQDRCEPSGWLGRRDDSPQDFMVADCHSTDETIAYLKDASSALYNKQTWSLFDSGMSSPYAYKVLPGFPGQNIDGCPSSTGRKYVAQSAMRACDASLNLLVGSTTSVGRLRAIAESVNDLTRYVKVSLEGEGKRFLSLAEVEVYAADNDSINVARQDGATADQSSTVTYGTHSASTAVDGDTNSFTHTEQENHPWWMVTLGKRYHVKKVVVWNRNTDSVKSRLSHAKVTLLDSLDQIVEESSPLGVIANGAASPLSYDFSFVGGPRPNNMPGSCCLDNAANSQFFGYDYVPIIKEGNTTTEMGCENPGPWHLGISKEACTNAGGQWTRSPCETLKKCIDSRPSDGDIGFSPAFEQFAKGLVIENSSDEDQCREARSSLGYDKDYGYDAEICERFKNNMCGDMFDHIDAASWTTVEGGSTPVPFGASAYPAQTDLPFKELPPRREFEAAKVGTNRKLDLEENLWLAAGHFVTASEHVYMNVMDAGESVCKVMGGDNLCAFGCVPNIPKTFCEFAMLVVQMIAYVPLLVATVLYSLLDHNFVKATIGPSDQLDSHQMTKYTYENFKNFYPWTVQSLDAINENINEQHKRVNEILHKRHENVQNCITCMIEDKVNNIVAKLDENSHAELDPSCENYQSNYCDAHDPNTKQTARESKDGKLNEHVMKVQGVGNESKPPEEKVDVIGVNGDGIEVTLEVVVGQIDAMKGMVEGVKGKVNLIEGMVKGMEDKVEEMVKGMEDKVEEMMKMIMTMMKKTE